MVRSFLYIEKVIAWKRKVAGWSYGPRKNSREKPSPGYWFDEEERREPQEGDIREITGFRWCFHILAMKKPLTCSCMNITATNTDTDNDDRHDMTKYEHRLLFIIGRIQARAISFRLDFIFYRLRARQIERISTFLLVFCLRVTLLIRNAFFFNYSSLREWG